MAEQKTVDDWLTYFGALSIGGLKQEEVELRLSVLGPALADELTDDAFTPWTARQVAKQFTAYFPTFGELYAALAQLLAQRRERERLLALPPPRPEAREPYQLPRPPEWCFERESRLMGGREPGELKIHAPIRTVAQQIALLNGEPAPLKAAATDVAQEVKRGPVLVEDEPEC